MNDGLKDRYRNAIIDVLSRCQHLERAVLFGSRALGSYSATSDIDIAVYGKDISLVEQARLIDQMEHLCVPQFIDIVVYHHIQNRALLKHIDEHGIQWWPRPNAQLQ